MTGWIASLRDYPAFSCAACRDAEKRDAAAPPCRIGVCPVAPPDGIEGIFVRVWSALRETAQLLESRDILAALDLTPDAAFIELVRAAQAAVRAPIRHKEVFNP